MDLPEPAHDLPQGHSQVLRHERANHRGRDAEGEERLVHGRAVALSLRAAEQHQAAVGQSAAGLGRSFDAARRGGRAGLELAAGLGERMDGSAHEPTGRMWIIRARKNVPGDPKPL